MYSQPTTAYQSSPNLSSYQSPAPAYGSGATTTPYATSAGYTQQSYSQPASSSYSARPTSSTYQQPAYSQSYAPTTPTTTGAPIYGNPDDGFTYSTPITPVTASYVDQQQQQQQQQYVYMTPSYPQQNYY